MDRRVATSLQLLVAIVLLSGPGAAGAIPAFARKYETSCLTCHSIYPRLTPFGEAFRRNGYRFPGVDSDYVKMPQIPLGQEANKKTFPSTGWPSSLPGGSVLAVGANGQAAFYPQKDASTPRQNHDVRFSLDDLVAEGHVWAGAALDDTITLWGELTFSHGSADVEHAQVLFNDLLGPKHAVNLVVGHGFLTISSFGPHSSYIADQRIANVPVTGIYGLSTDPFVLVDNYNALEVNGVVEKYADYSFGVSAGKNGLSSVPGVNAKANSENFYGHVGYKFGGLRLDGEGTQGPKDALKPWAEDAVTIDLFALRSREVMGGQGTPFTTDLVSDTSRTFGGAVRGQLGSAEVDVVFYGQRHDRGWIDGSGNLAPLTANVTTAELSYVVFPWMVPALRLERIGLHPKGGANVSDFHVMPGIAFLIRANLKAVLVANIERAGGFPVGASGGGLAWDGGAADWGSLVAAPKSDPGQTRTEFESIQVFFAWAM